MHNVRCASDLLAEIADPDKSLSQTEVLATVHGAAVAAMSMDAKDAAYMQIKLDRMSQREDVTLSAAATLLQASTRPASLDQVVSEQACADDFARQRQAAISGKMQVGAVRHCLEESLNAQKIQLARCKDRKLECFASLNSQRDSLKRALHELQRQEAKYQDMNIECEALRLQSGKLEQSITTTEHELEAAQDVSQSALDALGKWQQHAEENEQRVREHVDTAALSIVSREAPSMQMALLNVQLAIKWLTHLLQDKNSELISLEREKACKEKKLQDLRARMADASQDITAVQTQHAREKDEHKQFHVRIKNCQEQRQRIHAELDRAKSQCDSIMGSDLHNSIMFGFRAREEEITQEACRLSSSSFTVLPLWPKVSSPCSTGELASDGVLQTVPSMTPEVQQAFERLWQEKTKELMQQMMADLIYRRSRNSELGSEADDSWDIASLEREQSMAEGFASRL